MVNNRVIWYILYTSMPKPNDTLHRYQEIARTLRHQILRRDFGNDGRLPGERVLGEQFQVQRNTIRQALAILEKEGHIVRDEKRGSFVRLTGPRVDQNVFLLSIHRESMPDLNHLAEGFSKVVEKAGYVVRRQYTDPPIGAAIDIVPDASTLPKEVAGVLLWPQNPSDVESLKLLNAAIPLVLVDRRVLGLSSDCVRFDDVHGGQMVTEHLLSQGHKRIAFLTDEVFAETVQQRWLGYVKALESARIPINPAYGLFFQGIPEETFRVSLRNLLGRGEKSPTAIVCSNDLVAFMLLRFLSDEGIRVPDDIAVTGYGNSLPDYLDAMTLTSVEQSFNLMGQSAAAILLDRVNQTKEERLKRSRDTLIPVRLIPRGSSARQILD
ncbi:MAG: hypothetical protein BGO01_01815 [Armatimonadetes bacterium 55-13]|nr:MAG: hypothetical protein BGO01_01815 [Armatimonadetes bacterium 55-13]